MSSPPPLVARWMIGALVVGALAGAWSGTSYMSWAEKHDRQPPAANACFRVLQKRLAVPAIVAPSEPFTLPDGQTIYLSDSEFKSMTCSIRLGGDVTERLARTFGIEDPDLQAAAFAKLLTDVPADPAYDKELFSLWRLMSGAVLSLPESPAQQKAKVEIDEAVGCRFNHARLPSCSTRPPMPAQVIPAAVVGGVAVAAALLVLLARLVGRLRVRMAGGGRSQDLAASEASGESSAD